jgi:hypothetical protein
MQPKSTVRQRVVLGLAVAITLALGACATGPKFTEMQSAIPPLAADQGRIFFHRTNGAGMAMQPTVVVNGVAVGSAVPGSFFFIDRPPTTYVVSATTEAQAWHSCRWVPARRAMSGSTSSRESSSAESAPRRWSRRSARARSASWATPANRRSRPR